MTQPSDLPNHLLTETVKFQQYVVFVYEQACGWWRRECAFSEKDAALRRADSLNDKGEWVIVGSQVVTHSPVTPIYGASGSQAAS